MQCDGGSKVLPRQWQCSPKKPSLFQYVYLFSEGVGCLVATWYKEVREIEIHTVHGGTEPPMGELCLA